MGRWRIAFPYLLFAAMTAPVVWSNARGTSSQPVNMRAGSEAPRPDPNICPACGMTVIEGRGVSAKVDDCPQRFCCESCRHRYLEGLSSGKGRSNTGPDGNAGREQLIDPVCNMEVNQAWGFACVHNGRTFHFCTARCREAFAADPEAYLADRCIVCDTPLGAQRFNATYLGRTFSLCSEMHRQQFKADPASFFLHTMWGIPDWLYYASIAVVLVISFLMLEGFSAFRRRGAVTGRSTAVAASPSPAAIQDAWTSVPRQIPIVSAVSAGGAAVAELIAVRSRPDRPPPVRSQRQHASLPNSMRTDRIDLMRRRPIRRLLLSRRFRFCAQLGMVIVFLTILAAGLFGNQNPALNIAPLLTWTIWWGGLVVLIMFAGNAWCYLCPWDAIAGWTEKLRLWKKTDNGTGLGLAWPRVFRNILIATILFVGLTWVELGFGVTTRPLATAYLGIAMLVMAIVSAFLFDRKSFCRYGCLVGRVSGLYAMFSGIEVRRRKDETCRSCRTRECIRGSETAYACPTFENPAKLAVNTYCIQCTECLQACPHDNLAVNLRPWGSDLAAEGKPRSNEAYLALLMLSITGFHGLTMTPAWARLTGWLQDVLPVGQILAFSAGMLGLMVSPILIYAMLVGVSYLITERNSASIGSEVSYRDYFIRYAYCVLPIALFYHLAHNLEHLLMEGPKVIALASDPFGWGWNVWGTADVRVPPLVSLDVLWIIQVVLVGVGHVYSLWAAQKISRRLFSDSAAASRGQWPMLVGMMAFSVFSLWLLKQPMEMRTSAM